MELCSNDDECESCASRYCIHWPTLDRTIDPHTDFVSNCTSIPTCIGRLQAAPRVPRSITLRLPLFYHLLKMKNGIPHITDALVDFYAEKNAFSQRERRITVHALLFEAKWSSDRLYRHANKRFNPCEMIVTQLLFRKWLTFNIIPNVYVG